MTRSSRVRLSRFRRFSIDAGHTTSVELKCYTGKQILNLVLALVSCRIAYWKCKFPMSCPSDRSCDEEMHKNLEIELCCWNEFSHSKIEIKKTYGP